MPDIQWRTPDGSPKSEEQWLDPHARSIGMLLAGDAGRFLGETGQPETDDLLYLTLNAHTEEVAFRLPEIPGGRHWRCLIDTTDPTGRPGETPVGNGAPHPVPARALMVFALSAEQ